MVFLNNLKHSKFPITLQNVANMTDTEFFDLRASVRKLLDYRPPQAQNQQPKTSH